MKNQIFTIAALSLCLLTVPSWAMNDDSEVRLNKATRLPAAPAVARVTDADDDSSSSSSSDSSSSESEADQLHDKNSNTFLVYIRDCYAAQVYKHIVVGHNFSVKHYKRDHMQGMDPSTAAKFLDDTRSIFRLCKTMKGALKRFGATQTLNDVNGHSLLVALTAREEQSAKAVAGHCGKSDFVYKVFADEDSWNAYRRATLGVWSSKSKSSSASAEALLEAFVATGHFKVFDSAQGVEQFFASRPSTTTVSGTNAQADRSSVGPDGANLTSVFAAMGFSEGLSRVFGSDEDKNEGGRDGDGSE